VIGSGNSPVCASSSSPVSGAAKRNVITTLLGDSSIYEAKRILRDEIAFFGLTEYYEESLCAP
jgi:hypothetical protein